MVKVKTFTSQLKIFQMMKELADLDNHVNDFITENGIKKVISVSDALSTGTDGETIGVTRVIAYEAK